MIGQEDEGIQRPSRPPDRALQASHQPPAVGIVLDDVLPAVTPYHDMMDGIGILDPQPSCHRPMESSSRISFYKTFCRVGKGRPAGSIRASGFPFPL